MKYPSEMAYNLTQGGLNTLNVFPIWVKIVCVIIVLGFVMGVIYYVLKTINPLEEDKLK